MGVRLRGEVSQGAIMPCGTRRRQRTLVDHVAAAATWRLDPRQAHRPLEGASSLALNLMGFHHGIQCHTIHRELQNKSKIVGQKAPFKLKDIWALRVRLQRGTMTGCSLAVRTLVALSALHRHVANSIP
jgi:hypothetical protein